MEFTKYQSLVNESMKNVGPFLRDEKVANANCIVSEKIHGANFSMYLKRGGYINFASRSQMLSPDTNFMNCQRFFTEERKTVIAEAAESLFTCDIEEIRFIGEIFGGLDIAGIKPVQREVHYSGDIQFRAFSIEILKKGGNLITMPWRDVNAMCHWIHIGTVPVIAAGPFLELYTSLSTNVNSKLSDKDDNICEGFCFRIEAEEEFGQPLVFKKRNTGFLESKGTAKAVGNTQEQTELGLEAITRASSFVTPQRVSNVNSHYGFDSLKFFQQLMTAVIEDVLTEYNTEYGVNLRDEPVWKEIKGDFGKLLIPLIRAELSK